MRWLISLILVAVFSLPAAAADRAIIILDGSGSMWAQIGGEARISIARKTLDDVLKAVPDDLELGLMSYGHREKGSCDDIQMLVEPAPGTAAAISDAAAGISPKGKTPLSAAVRMAAEDLRYTEEKATVILITDGLETCEADPCALATELENSGVDFTTHVVGFGLTEEEGHQVACLAENTGGKYIQASDADALSDALRTTVAEATAAEPKPAPEPATLEFNLAPELILAEGEGAFSDADASVGWDLHLANSDGTEGDFVRTEYGADWKSTVEPGDYILTASVHDASVSAPVSITADKLATPLIVLNAGKLTIRPFAAAGEDINRGAAVEFTFADGDSTTNYGEVSRYVPAGKVEVSVTIGSGNAIEIIDLPAGGNVSRDIVLGVGRATVIGFYVEGMRVEEGGLAVRVLGAKKDIQGNRKDFGTSYGSDVSYDLPPGDYVALLSMGPASVETPFTVNSGEAVEVTGVLNAGVAAISLPNGKSIDIVAAKKDIQGNRDSFVFGYGDSLQATLPAGDYVVLTKVDGSDNVAETPLSVTAGERTELTIQ